MKKKFNNLISILKKNELRILPGNLSYSFVLSLIPIISLIVYFTTSYNLPNEIIGNFINESFPKGVVDLLEPVLYSSLSLKSLMIMFIGIFVAMNGCGAIIIASDTVFELDVAPLYKRLIKSLVLVILLILLFSFIFVVPLLGRTIINLIGMATSFISDNQTYIDKLYFILQVPVSLIIMFYIIKLVYIIAPDDKISSKSVNVGALFTTIMWLVFTIIFSYYINNIAEYDAIYGNLGNLIILLFYFYILAYIFVIGLCLNKRNSDKNIEKTNTIKLEEIRKKMRESEKRK